MRLTRLPHTTNGWHKFGKGVGILALLLGVAYLIGALSGAATSCARLAISAAPQCRSARHLAL